MEDQTTVNLIRLHVAVKVLVLAAVLGVSPSDLVALVGAVGRLLG